MYSEIKQLLENGISDDPLMLHGTSIQAVFELAKTGALPPGIPSPEDSGLRDPTKDRLYFTPVHSSFVGTGYESFIGTDKKDAIRNSTSYAKYRGFSGYFANEIGCKTAKTYMLVAYLEMNTIDWEDFREGLKQDGIELSMKQIDSLYNEGRKRNGVVIEPNKNVLELENGIIDGDLMFFVCPDGMDKKYIKGIELQGPVEKRMMQKFLDGKLEYRGFRTE